MIVLGSSYRPVMGPLARKIADIAQLRDFEENVPLRDQLADIDVLVLGHQKVTAEDFASAPNLKLIQQHGRGVDGVDMNAARGAGVIVANVPGGNSVAVAEHCLALILFQAKKFNSMNRSISAGIVGAPEGIEIGGKTLLIIGLGASGTELARMAKALGMEILATKARPELKPEVELDSLGGSDRLNEFLAKADFVALTATLNDQTVGMIGEAEFKIMKPTAYLTNVARGALVDYDALLAALRSRQIAGAAFDTFWREPAELSDPMLALENFVLTPHVAGFSDVAIEQVTEVMARNIKNLAEGADLAHVVGKGT